MQQKNRIKLIVSVLAIIICFALLVKPLALSVKQGLDLQGGTHVVLQAEDTPEAKVDDDAMNRSISIIERRVNELGLTEPVIQRQGRDRIIVELPGVKDPEQAIAMLGKTAMLEFKDMEGNTVLTGKDLKDSKASADQSGRPVVTLQFNEEGAKKFAELTAKNVGNQIAILLDGKVLTAPRVSEPITGGNAQITGSQNAQEAEHLAILLRSGSLPIKLEVVENRTVGPTLGQDSKDKSVKAFAIGVAGVFIFMLFFYRLSGFIADVVLLLYTLLVLAVMKGLNATLTLPGIAGIILSIGMAVDANVLIFERFKEELKAGKTLRAAVNAGFSRAFVTIMDSNVTTIMAAAVLFYLGTGPIRGFAVTLALGVLISMFTAITVTKFILNALVGSQFTKNPFFYGASLPKKIRRWKNEALFHCEKAKVFFSISLIFLLVGVVSMLTRGFNLGIDFTGGSIIDVKFENPVTVSEVRDVLSDHKLGSSIIQLGSMDGQQTEESQSVLIRTGIISDDQRVETMTDMTNRLGPNEVLRVENVGATVGRDLVKSAMGAVALSWVLMIIYITIRFEHNFAFAAIIALIIDVMVTLSWFSLLQLEMDSSFVAALLTVVGYSINGTIVILTGSGKTSILTAAAKAWGIWWIIQSGRR